MRKRVIIKQDIIFKGIYETIYEEGIPFPSDWRWLSRALTDWKVKSKMISWDKPSPDYLKRKFGDDVRIISN